MQQLSRSWPAFALVAILATLSLFALACSAETAPPAKAPEAAKAAPPTEAPKAAPAAAASEANWPGKPASVPVLGGVPNAPPRPTPVPPPPGSTPPPPPTPPAAKIVPLYAHVDTVTAGPGESKFNVDANLSCVKTSVFSRGMHIVWRMEVVDTSGGKILQAADVKDATLKLSHGEEVKFRFGPHGRTGDIPWFWTAAWDVPMDYPLGVLDYGISVATQDGKSLVFGDPLTMRVPDFQPGVSLDTRVTIVR